ncbi:MAG: ferrochelatase [Acidobacteriota bacterium]
MNLPYDALLIVSYGGPERREDVMPFLENVLRGKAVPEARKWEVAEHYYHFGGVSPINQQNRELIAALQELFSSQGPQLPIYWGNRNWHPFLHDTVRRMVQDGIRRALAFVTSAYGSYSGCRQYLEDIGRARAAVGSDAPRIDKIRLFYNHPGFIAANVARVREALGELPEGEREGAPLVFTAHSIPVAMAETSPYVAQLEETARLVAEGIGRREFHLAYQSRSGPPHQPWLEPDVADLLQEMAGQGVKAAVVAPIGFISDHMEVLYDLDVELAAEAQRLGLKMVRAKTVGTHPEFVSMVRELVLERMNQSPVRRYLGSLGPWPDFCPPDCCRRK